MISARPSQNVFEKSQSEPRPSGSGWRSRRRPTDLGEDRSLTVAALISPARRRCHSFRCGGFTLLEVLLAIGLMILVSTLMFVFYHGIVLRREVVREAVNSGYLARTIADQIADEIRACNGFVPTAGPGVSGTDRIITIQTVTLPDKELFRRLSIKDEPLPAQSDVRQVQYYLAYDDEEPYTYPDGTESDTPLGLVRREMKTLYQTPGAFAEADGTGEEGPFSPEVDLDLISPELKYVRFRYFDGVDWLDQWDISNEPEAMMGNSLPQAVEITVGYLELPPPNEEDEGIDPQESDLTPSEPEPYSPKTYTVMVRLPQADSFFGSRMMRAQRRSRLGNSSGGGGQ